MNNLKNIYLLLSLIITTLSLSYGQTSDLGSVCAESLSSYGVVGFSDSEYLWAVAGGVIVEGDGEDTISVLWGRETGTFQIDVIERSASNCTGAPSIAEVTVQAPEVDLGFDFFEICDGDSMVFDASGDYSGSYTTEWQDGSFEPTFSAKETELVWVRVTDGLGCVRFDSVDFTAFALPVVYIGEDTVLCDVENPLILTALDSVGASFSSYEWYSSSRDALVSASPTLYVGPGYDTISLAINDYNGCLGSDTILIMSCDVSEMFKDMVNTFTPNGDGLNETWTITNFMHLFPDAVLEVFDRWGRLVYRTENVYEEPWDGASNGRDMPMDAYFFVLELNYMNLEALSGSVNLIR